MTRPEAPDRVGPNAAVQLAAALSAACGDATARCVFAEAGLADWTDHPPQTMIAEADAARLHARVHAVLSPVRAEAVLADAGRRTGAYLLENRIPKPAQAVLRVLPRALSLRLFLAAIGAHAWTFAGSGAFAVQGLRLRIGANPLARAGPTSAPSCTWHVHVFDTLLNAVAPGVRTTEVACCSTGAPACVFEVSAVGTAPVTSGEASRRDAETRARA